MHGRLPRAGGVLATYVSASSRGRGEAGNAASISETIAAGFAQAAPSFRVTIVGTGNNYYEDQGPRNARTLSVAGKCV